MSGGRKGLLIVFLVGLAVRFPLLLNMAPQPESLLRPDSPTYYWPARNLIAHGVFSVAPAPPFKPDAERTPGYPLYLAAHFLVSGSFVLPAATQVVMDAGTGVLAAAAATTLSAQPAAWLAGILYALDPIAAAHAPIIGSEPLFNFLLALSLLLLLRTGAEPRRTLLVALSGLCLGGATWVRPITVYLWLPWSLALGWAWRGRWRRQALTFAAGALLLPGAWCLRNWTIWRSFGYNQVRATDAVLWEAAAVQASLEKISFDQARAQIKKDFDRRNPEPIDDPIERARLIQQDARSRIKGHYGLVLKLYPVSLVKMMLGPGLDMVADVLWPGQVSHAAAQSPVYKVAGSGTRDMLRQKPILWAVWAWVSAVLAVEYILAALGAWILWRNRRWFDLAATLVPIGFLLAISAGGWAYYRHRVPLLPLLAALAGAAWDRRGARSA